MTERFGAWQIGDDVDRGRAEFDLLDPRGGLVPDTARPDELDFDRVATTYIGNHDHSHWIMEDDGGSRRRVKPRPLRWDFPTDSIGSRLVELYGKLIKIRLAHSALRSDSFYPGDGRAGRPA